MKIIDSIEKWSRSLSVGLMNALVVAIALSCASCKIYKPIQPTKIVTIRDTVVAIRTDTAYQYIEIGCRDDKPIIVIDSVVNGGAAKIDRIVRYVDSVMVINQDCICDTQYVYVPKYVDREVVIEKEVEHRLGLSDYVGVGVMCVLMALIGFVIGKIVG